MIKKIEMPDMRAVIIREPINIDEPIILDDHIPHKRPYTNNNRDLCCCLSYGTQFHEAYRNGGLCGKYPLCRGRQKHSAFAISGSDPISKADRRLTMTELQDTPGIV